MRMTGFGDENKIIYSKKNVYQMGPLFSVKTNIISNKILLTYLYEYKKGSSVSAKHKMTLTKTVCIVTESHKYHHPAKHSNNLLISILTVAI